MKIGYDGKRAFQNRTGLGNYSRSLIDILSRFYPQHQYLLFAPKQTGLFKIEFFKDVKAVLPQNLFSRKLPTLWRRYGMVKAIQQAAPDIYHGVSNELPNGIEKIPVKTVVTVHDLIFERFPRTYNFDERFVHRWKIKKACLVADAVIAISRQTRDDLIDFYNIDPAKIFTCYQSCNPLFEQTVTGEEKELVRKRYNLPVKYFLFVSSIAPRKNLVAVCNAMILLKDIIRIPLVVIGDGKKEKVAVKDLMKINGMEDQLILLNELPVAKESAFTSAADFPAIYQQATAMVYPSVFEGFGLPVLEALWSGLPVICSNTSSLPEVAGEAALYFAPDDHALLAKHLLAVASDPVLCDALRSNGLKQAQKFGAEQYAKNIMEVYKKIL